MVEKKDGQLVLHVPKSVELQFKSLAELDGLTVSEKGAKLVMDHLAEELQRFEAMKSVFEPQR